MTTASAVRPRPLSAPRPPLRDRKHLAFVRSHPCAVCKSWRVEAAHVGPRGLGQIADDRQAIPLCRKHHRDDRLSFHRLGRMAFERQHGIDIANLIEQLNELNRSQR